MAVIHVLMAYAVTSPDGKRTSVSNSPLPLPFPGSKRGENVLSPVLRGTSCVQLYNRHSSASSPSRNQYQLSAGSSQRSGCCPTDDGAGEDSSSSTPARDPLFDVVGNDELGHRDTLIQEESRTRTITMGGDMPGLVVTFPHVAERRADRTATSDRPQSPPRRIPQSS